MNSVWKLDSEFLAAYTESKVVMRRVKRSFPTFELMATYTKNGKQIGVQYKVPAAKKRTAYRLFS